jgi:type I restriction enzyme S subunit
MELKPGYKQTEVGVIPEEWDCVRIGDVAETSSGATPARSKQQDYFDGGVIPWVKTLDLNNSLILNSDECVTAKALQVTSLRIYPKESVLVAMYGGFNQIGRTGLLAMDATINQALTAIRPASSKLSSRYLLCYLNFRVEYWKSVASSSRKDPNITGKDVRDFPLPLPPLKEQESIGEALQHIDDYIHSLVALISKKDQLKQAAMQELLTGKRRLPGFEGEWEVFSLGSVASMNSGGTPPTGRDNYYGGGIPWVSISDMTSGGKFISETERSLSEAGLTNCSARRFPAGTVLYAMYASLGECGIAAIEVTTSQAILGIRPGSSLHNEFLYYYLTWIHDRVKLMGQQGTQSNLNKRIVQGFTLKLPDRAEQIAIANVLGEIDQELDTIDLKLQKIRAMKSGMMQELLTGRIRLQ